MYVSLMALFTPRFLDRPRMKREIPTKREQDGKQEDSVGHQSIKIFFDYNT